MYLPYQLSSYHPEKVLNLDFMCPIIVKNIKAKVKSMSRDLPFYAAFKSYPGFKFYSIVLAKRSEICRKMISITPTFAHCY